MLIDRRVGSALIFWGAFCLARRRWTGNSLDGYSCFEPWECRQNLGRNHSLGSISSLEIPPTVPGQLILWSLGSFHSVDAHVHPPIPGTMPARSLTGVTMCISPICVKIL